MSLLKKAAYRTIRYHPLVEAAQARIRRTSHISLNGIAEVAAGPGDVLIDCGANVGDVCSRLARTGATVFAFEPQPLCYRIIEHRFRLLPNVHCLNKGAMHRNGNLLLSTPSPTREYDAIDSTVAASFVRTPSDHTSSVEVECVDFAEFVERQKRVKFIKMDVEGAEIQIINHLIDTGVIELIDLMVVETHERFSPELAEATRRLRSRIEVLGLASRINLDWY